MTMEMWTKMIMTVATLMMLLPESFFAGPGEIVLTSPKFIGRFHTFERNSKDIRVYDAAGRANRAKPLGVYEHVMNHTSEKDMSMLPRKIADHPETMIGSFFGTKRRAHAENKYTFRPDVAAPPTRVPEDHNWIRLCIGGLLFFTFHIFNVLR